MFLFIFEGERDRARAGRSRDRETQNPKQAPGSELSAQEPNAGLELMNLEIMAEKSHS